ncbi:hypothetical protein EV702DRAFT_1205043 [Suillus placidus]|uniref:Uncharacterized protein n=1 Tax=Suillus placidus TaxID=48579 RepID=A0A9P6ZGR2_9AGAM|nr:hypothetical protein EV702DRAFT_1205043 [Suillus placidus]
MATLDVHRCTQQSQFRSVLLLPSGNPIEPVLASVSRHTVGHFVMFMIFLIGPTSTHTPPAALKQDTPNWCLLNLCPACFYKLQDELPLDFDWLVCIDGNNSLKRWDSSIYGNIARLDSCQARSDYWIGAEAVDKYKHEVKLRDIDSHHDDWEEEPVEATESSNGILTCVD